MAINAYDGIVWRFSRTFAIYSSLDLNLVDVGNPQVCDPWDTRYVAYTTYTKTIHKETRISTARASLALHHYDWMISGTTPPFHIC
jgi:hypothetical protein